MTEPTPLPERSLDFDSLKGLSHPLRAELFNLLSVHGPATASGLAERLGESSGATSYHLRQLERHGFVREVEGRGTARERWWERVPGSISLSAAEIGDSPAAQSVTRTALRQWERQRSELLNDYLALGFDRLPEWVDSSSIATANLRLTKEQLAEVVASWDAWAKETFAPLRDQNLPGSRPVQIHFNAFPVLDGVETPAEESDR
jgi:DNA-binding transcriptional ArsR family regulator